MLKKEPDDIKDLIGDNAKIKNGVFDDLFVFKAFVIAPCPTHEALGPNNPNNEQWINNRK